MVGRTAQRLVYVIVLGSPGKVSAIMVTLYPPFSWIFTAVVRPTTPVRIEDVRDGVVWHTHGLTCADDYNSLRSVGQSHTSTM